MRRLMALVVLAALAGGMVSAGEKGGPKDKPDEKEKGWPRRGLVAHYFKDPVEWDGNWKEGEKPAVNPKDWTFREYRYSRMEPLINHLFTKRGWFSVRWVGYLRIRPGLKKDDVKPGDECPINKWEESDDPVEVSFEFWADDGARLFIDGEKVIDDWRACAEGDPESHRQVKVELTPGPHRIVVEYFQGEMLTKADRDPTKLYWSSQDLKIPRQIVPASHFFHEEADLEDYEPSTQQDEPEEEGEGEGKED